jgi:protein SCO1
VRLALALAIGLGALVACAGFSDPAAAHDPAHPAQSAEPDPLADRFGGAFTLTDHTGKRVSEEDYHGRYTLVYFGYTRCGDLCPLDLLTIAHGLGQAGDAAAKVQPLFITVDPAFDTPAVLADYVQNFHPRLVGLTGTQAEIDAAAKAWHVRVHKIEQKPVLGKADFFIDHGSLAFLMGPDGKFVTLFPHGTKAEKLAAALRDYVK